jgi:hypothetical protein
MINDLKSEKFQSNKLKGQNDSDTPQISFSATTHSEIVPLIHKSNKKKLIYITIILLLVAILGSAGFFAVKYYKKSSASVPNNLDNEVAIVTDTPTPTPKPIKPAIKSYANPMTGVLMAEDAFNQIKNRPALAVMIQNNVASRPEWGLNEAEVVYETLTESSITRFMGVFWSKDAERVMSVRSARKYFVELLGDFKGVVYMHIGQSEGEDNISAVNALARYKIKDLTNKAGSFIRDRECQKTKAIEHCAYSTTQLLWDLASRAGWNADITAQESWKFKNPNDPEVSKGESLTDFTVHFPKSTKTDYTANYSVIWRYDPVSNKYKRFELDGRPFVDGLGKQVETDIHIYQKIVSSPTGDFKGHQLQQVIGTGTGYVMQNGKVYNVTWKKPDFATKTRFFDTTTGKEFVFNRGKVWVSLVQKSADYVDNSPKVPTKVTVTP